MEMLQLNDLHKTFNPGTVNEKVALNGVSLHMEAGDFATIVGSNGAGKSTTLKPILGLVHPDGGDVRFFGQDVRQHEREFKEQIGVVLGGIDFYPKKKVKTITDVTRRFYDNWDEEKYRHYLQLFALDESKRVDQLSSGMKVKYLLALALSHNAKLLILDEPTSGLDGQNMRLIAEKLKSEARRGRTILVITHDKELIERCCDRIAKIGVKFGEGDVA